MTGQAEKKQLSFTAQTSWFPEQDHVEKSGYSQQQRMLFDNFS